MTRRLEGKVAVVFGAGSIGPGWGNGKAAAVAYARAGAAVFAIDVNPAAARETCDLIVGEGGRCVAHAADIADDTAVSSAFEACSGAFGGVDILHNNVGVSAMGGPTEIDEATWDRVLDANLKGMFLSCRHAIPRMEKRGGGAIVNIGSVSGMRYLGLPQISYATAKGGLVTMTKAIAAQYGRKNIRANVISPGIIDTPLLAVGASTTFRATFGVSDPEQARALRAKTIPLGRFGDAWDVANAAVFLASDEAKYITGAELVIDGGLTCQVQFPLRADDS